MATVECLSVLTTRKPVYSSQQSGIRRYFITGSNLCFFMVMSALGLDMSTVWSHESSVCLGNLSEKRNDFPHVVSMSQASQQCLF